MIVQEPVQAAIWHCLNHYDYSDAIFLSERLYAEVKTDDSLFLLATSYYRSGQVDHAYHTLKGKGGVSSQCRYLLGNCAFKLKKFAEAESILLNNQPKQSNFEELVRDYEEQACFVLLLLGKIYEKTARKEQALEAFKKSLKLNPFLWSSFKHLCDNGNVPKPEVYFQLNDLENLSFCHGVSLNNIESVVLSSNNATNMQSDGSIYQTFTPQQLLGSHASENSFTPTKLITPEDCGIQNSSIIMSGFGVLPQTRSRGRFRMIDSISTPNSGMTASFGHLIDRCEDNNLSPSLSGIETNDQKSISKKMRAHVGSLVNRKEALLQNSKPVFSQTSNVSNTIPTTPIIPTPVTVTASQNVRRSSRLFSNSYSVKENNKSPNRNKFATPKSPSRKTKQRLNKCNLNEFNYLELNNKNRMKKEITETVTSTQDATGNSKSTNNSAILMANSMNATSVATQLQKESAEGLMHLLRNMGRAYAYLAYYKCKDAIEELNELPPHQFHTSCVYNMLGLAYFEIADYENCVKYLGEIHSREPNRVESMDVYSTALWHLQKEVQLSALAQDLIQNNKNSAITWMVSGNCFSLHKEHDTAIKYLQRAVQVDSSLPYAFTLLGHEYIMTEELDKAMSCYSNAIRLDERHYNAWFGIGTIYSKQERFRLAELNYYKALAINPYNPVILCHIGVVQHALKKTDAALNTLNDAIQCNPKDALCKFHRGSIYFNVGRYAEALKELEELKEIVPKESLVYYLIGKVHKKLGNIDLALMHFSWATDLDPKGASNQIKEAFDPSIGRVAEMESPSTPQPIEEELPSDPTSPPFPRVLHFGRYTDDSEDSL